MVKEENKVLRSDLKENREFVDFTNLRIDSFTNVLKQHTTDHIAHTEKLTLLQDSYSSFETRLKILEEDEIFQLQSGRLREIRDEVFVLKTNQDTGIQKVKNEFLKALENQALQQQQI